MMRYFGLVLLSGLCFILISCQESASDQLKKNDNFSLESSIHTAESHFIPPEVDQKLMTDFKEDTKYSPSDAFEYYVHEIYLNENYKYKPFWKNTRMYVMAHFIDNGKFLELDIEDRCYIFKQLFYVETPFPRAVAKIGNSILDENIDYFYCVDLLINSILSNHEAFIEKNRILYGENIQVYPVEEVSAMYKLNDRINHIKRTPTD